MQNNHERWIDRGNCEKRRTIELWWGSRVWREELWGWKRSGRENGNQCRGETLVKARDVAWGKLPESMMVTLAVTFNSWG